MKVIIQIPCFNEEGTLSQVFEQMPRSIPGVDVIEFQIVDDGSTDGTIEIARQLGIHHIIRAGTKNRRWLGRAFRCGIDHALKNGADIVVNTDGDNQYPSRLIPDLIKPIVEGRADIVIGDRKPGRVQEFSWLKKRLQVCGSSLIQFLTGSPVKDAVSGFRAYSRHALLQIHVITNYTYTVDTLIQAHKKGLDIEWLPIPVNPKTRDSRLITSLFTKVRKSGTTIVRLVTLYEPFKTFLWLTSLFFVPGMFLLGRYLYLFFFVAGEARGHIQSVVAGGILLTISVQMFVLGIIADLLSANRCMIEDALTRLKRLEYKQSHALSERKPTEQPSKELGSDQQSKPLPKTAHGL